jgi:hypothetical protein
VEDPLARAVELLGAGVWQQAHAIVQKDKSTLAAWLHGIVHTLEGDFDNARYWYDKADRRFPGPEAVQAEIAAARQRVQSRQGVAGGQRARQKDERGSA